MLIDTFGRFTVEITRDQLEAWAGRELTDDEVTRLDDAIPNSSIPDAVGAIVDGFPEDTDEDAEQCARCGNEPVTDEDSGLGDACRANNDSRVIL